MKPTVLEGVILLFVSLSGIILSFFSHYSFSVQWKLSPYLFPLAISFFLFILSVSLILEGMKEGRNEKKEKREKMEKKTLLLFILSLIIYLLALNYLGFIISSFLLLTYMMFLLGEKRWWFIVLVSALTVLAVYLLFGVYLSLMLPKGKLLIMMGL